MNIRAMLPIAAFLAAVPFVLAVQIPALSLVVLEKNALAEEAPAGPAPKNAPQLALRRLDDVIASSNSFVITGVTLFDGEKVVDRATVAVRDGWISKVCAADADCASPGLAS